MTKSLLGLPLAVAILLTPLAQADISNFASDPFFTGHAWGGSGTGTPGYDGWASAFTVTAGYNGAVTIEVPLFGNSNYDPNATIELLGSDPNNSGLPDSSSVLGSGDVLISGNPILSYLTIPSVSLTSGTDYWVAVIPTTDAYSGFSWMQNPGLLNNEGFTGNGTSWGSFAGTYPGQFDVLGPTGYPDSVSVPISPTPEPAQYISLSMMMVGLTFALWQKRKSGSRA